MALGRGAEVGYSGLARGPRGGARGSVTQASRTRASGRGCRVGYSGLAREVVGEGVQGVGYLNLAREGPVVGVLGVGYSGLVREGPGVGVRGSVTWTSRDGGESNAGLSARSRKQE